MINKGKAMFTPEKDNRIRLMNERINFVEKHFGELCSAFGAYTRKLGRYRDKHDELAKAFQTFYEEEPYNKGTARALDSLTKGITFMADYMDIKVQRLESKVINQLTPYENICRATRESLKSTILVRDKELSREKQLMEIRNKFTANTSAADSELLKLKVEVNRSNKDVDDVMENFEKRKLKDIKSMLLDFVAIEMKQHTKALEILTATYQDIADIDEKKDLQDFKRSLKNRNKSACEYARKSRSKSLENVAGIPGALHSRNPRLSRSNRNLAEASESDSDSSDESSDGMDEVNDEREPAPDQEDSDSESSEESSLAGNRNEKEPPMHSKLPKPASRVFCFKTTCEGIQVRDALTESLLCSRRTAAPEISRAHPLIRKPLLGSSQDRSIRIKSINGKVVM